MTGESSQRPGKFSKSGRFSGGDLAALPELDLAAGVGARPAVGDVPAPAAEEPVVAGPAAQVVVPGAAGDPVVAAGHRGEQAGPATQHHALVGGGAEDVPARTLRR